MAGTWHVLADYVSSPGGNSEALRVYLARDLTAVPEAERHERDGEELGMPVRWVALERRVTRSSPDACTTRPWASPCWPPSRLVSRGGPPSARWTRPGRATARRPPSMQLRKSQPGSA